MDETKHCPNCGKLLKADVKFCPYCGQAQPEMAGATDNDQANYENQSNNEQQTYRPDNENGDIRSEYSSPNMITSFKDFFGNMFHISGRMSRASYWWSYLDIVLIMIILTIFIILVGSSAENISQYAGIFVLLFLIVIPIAEITATCRRFHDINYSAGFWWLSFIPWVGGIAIFIFMLFSSVDEGNRFGEPDVSYLKKLN
ncbi:DUF805 domain-containing protein [Fructilactobacillus fructivorans]|uniref:Putative zinc-ribbon domain-containing protein n=1 Tax=Fructilactobacillus fructivorans TaxID=1614 RepID=A0A0C1LZL3_9LACO|nr:DUF805 domain-containing protein [Fructilactobacillus fructivorans]KID42315.1 putative protein of unknown function (DUF805) [Fructilactobacillus fructivorans]MCT0151066.1 DUF805 domain-containing protein [Fructilactobacillus fructivorans]MCT2867376.1 DUF805 domain-containing protein [Fructilactobacillus fructivorans]MCT2869105.1 DUF805 domain-containing protein [Fructilactobacillus fructivorans]MCT2873175.1 DUF805 domain-containing protein [Fructilactobacillus fructivorans]